MKSLNGFFSLLGSIHMLMGVNALAQDQNLSPITDESISVEQHAKLLGHDLGVSQQSAGLATQHGINTATLIHFLGNSKNLMDASLEAIPPATTADSLAPSPSPAADQGTVLANTNWYIAGTRVWTGHLNYQKGALVYTGGISPTQIPFPLVVYPLGPLTLQVDAGVDFQGALNASMSPGWAYPLNDTVLKGSLTSNLTAGGYLEGYAKLLVVRGGVGGKINLIDGSTGINAMILFNGRKPILSGKGKVQLLNGDIYAFVDTNVFLGKWKRILNKDLYKWNGKCFAFGSDTCVNP